MKHASTKRRIAQRDIDAFGRASAGSGRIHTDPVYARATRFGGPLVQGLYLVALIEKALHDATAAWGEASVLDVRFVSPVKAGQTITIDIANDDRELDDRCLLRVQVSTADGVAVVGTARLGDGLSDR
jgi:acyl dehydratase